MFLLLCGLAAAESRLVVTVDMPVGVWVDGQPANYAPGSSRLVMDDLAAGRHSVVIATPSGELVRAATLDLPDHAEARARLSRGRFSVVETVALPVPMATTWDTTDRVARDWGRRWLELVRGRHEYANTGYSEHCSMPAAVPVQVSFVSVDGEWANVRVDGELVGELRNFDSRSASITLTPGVHTVEVRPFMDDDVWAKGQLVVSGTEPIRVGISEDKLEVYNRQSAWRTL